MTIINIDDWMISGESKGYITDSTMGFNNLDPEDAGLFVRVDENGYMYGHRVVPQDLEWVGTDTTDITTSSSEVELVRVSVDHDISTENGSWAFTCKVDNGTSARDDFVTLILRDGAGAAIASKQYQIDKGNLGYPISMWGSFGQAWSSGTEFVISATSEQGSVIRGTMTPTAIKIVEAQAAAVSAMATAEKTLVLDPSIKSMRKQDITDALGASSQADLITADFTAMATNGNEFWQVFFSHQLNEFFTHEIMLASDGAKPDIAEGMEIHVDGNLGDNIDRTEIETAITNAGYNLPDRRVTFFVSDNSGDGWLVHYLRVVDKYSVEKLDLK